MFANHASRGESVVGNEQGLCCQNAGACAVQLRAGVDGVVGKTF